MEKIKETDELDLFAGLLTSAEIALNIYDRRFARCLYRNQVARLMFPATDGEFPQEYLTRIPKGLQPQENVTFNSYCDIDFGEKHLIGCEISATAGSWHDTEVVAVTLKDVSDSLRHNADNVVELLVERICENRFERVFLIQAPSGRLYDISGGAAAPGNDYEKTIVSEVSYKTAETNLNGLLEALSLGRILERVPSGTYCVPFRVYGKQGGVLHKRACFYGISSENGIILGTIEDVTEQTCSESKVRALETKVASLAEEIARYDICMRTLNREIRVPLNTILGLSRLSVSRAREREQELAENFEKIHFSSQAIREAADDIAMLLRDNGRSDMKRLGPVSLRELIHASAAAVHPFIQGHHIRFSCDTGELPVEFVALPEAELRRCLIRVLEDALELAPEGGECRYSLREEETEGGLLKLTFLIQVPGTVMDPERLQALQVLAKGERADAREIRLSGACMGIAMGFAKAIGGTLDISCANRTTVYSLSMSARAGSLKPQAEAEDSRKQFLYSGRILLADGKRLNLEVEKKLLENIGFSVVTARSGQEALDLFEQEKGKFQLVLLDMRLPGIDGIRCASLIRDCHDIGGESVPIVALTADAYEDDLWEAREAGIEAFLVKPMDADAIYGILERFHDAT